MRVFGLIGRDLEHSFSQDYFTEKFRALGLHDHVYLNFPLENISGFPGLLARAPGISGLNVTIPYKRQIIPMLDALTPEAEAIGAVNTICWKNGRMIGCNTDHFGFRESLVAILGSRKAASALVLGSGGASAAVCYALESIGISFDIVSRHPEGRQLSYDELTPERIAGIDLIVNTTPIGMYPDIWQSPQIPYEAIGRNHVLYDLIYNPSETRFLEEGRLRGAITQNGLDMLHRQADAAWAIWNSHV